MNSFGSSNFNKKQRELLCTWFYLVHTIGFFFTNIRQPASVDKYFCEMVFE